MKNIGVVVVIGGDNLPSPVGIGLTDLPNIGGASGPPGSGITALYQFQTENIKESNYNKLAEVVSLPLSFPF